MKKLHLFFAAILLSLVVSCSSDQLEGTGSGGGVRFNVTLEGQTPQSRAVGDGTTAKQLYYAVYETGTTTPLAVAPGTTPETMSGLTHTVNLSLVTGKTYDVVFWAQSPNAPYTFHPDGRTVDMNYDVQNKHDANDENRDAFFNVTTFTVTGPMEQSVELRRPFAQLNFGTADFDKAHNAGFDPIATAVTVSDVYPTFSLMGENGALTGTPQQVEFELNYFNSEHNSIGSSIEIAGQSYTYLSMNYLLAKPEGDVVDCSLTSYEAPGEMFQLDLSNVPVQRNYRTNIYGNLLTSKTTFNIEIKPGFNAPANNVEYVVRTASQLNEALNATPSSYFQK